MKLFMFAAIGLLAVATARGQGGNIADATALLHAVRGDVIILESTKSALRGAIAEGHITKAQYQCFEKLPSSAFTADLARYLARELTPGEIADALAFYRTPAGIKLSEFVFATLSREAEGPSAEPVPQPSTSVDEMKSIQDFMATSVGQKVAQNKLLMMSPESREISRRIVSKKLIACGAKVSP